MEQDSHSLSELEISKIKSILSLVEVELYKAIISYKPFNSPHEGYAVMLEEVDELWEEVKKKPSKVSVKKMQKEALQIAAMAVRFVYDSCRWK